MNEYRRVAFVAAACLAVALQGSAPTIVYANSRTLAILQSELQRNFQVLSKQDAPAYFMSYTLHETRTASLSASVGALQRSDEARSRFATVEVRVGDYFLDNTHPIRGDRGATGPRVSQVSLPLTD